MTERLSRAERRNLQRLDQRILGLPLFMGEDARPVAAHVRHVVHLLRTPQSASPCTEALAHIGALLDRTVPDSANKMIACRKGCSHCCSQLVIVTAPEAFAVAGQIAKRPKVVAVIKEVAASVGQQTMEERLKAMVFCPMLEDAACSIYGGRPLGCRGFVSVDLEACLKMFTRGEHADIPMPNDSVQVLYACRMLLAVALQVMNLREAVYEMNSAVARVLTTENAEARWLVGEDIFAGIQEGAPTPPQFAQAIQRLAEYVAPTV